jgi:hypothetical protein
MERANERVLVSTSRTTAELPWESRQALLSEFRHLDSARPIIDAFEAVGTSRSVTLPREQVAELYSFLNFWSGQVTIPNLPEGVWDLRCALADDLHDTRGTGH